WNRDRVIDALNNAGIPCNTGICPEIYKEKAFTKSNCRIQGAIKDSSGKKYLPVARKLGETSIMFMVHPTLNPASMGYVIDQVKIIMTEAIK
ncbi:MAG: aminotransferase, partial [Desulfobacteraceae bacterium]